MLRLAIAYVLLGSALVVQRVPAQAGWREVPQLAVRVGHDMTYDSVRKRVVLFGGRNLVATKAGPVAYYGDTWEWDGSRWESKTPLHSPGPRYSHAMAWDPVRKRVLLYGGVGWVNQTSVMLSDTWEWDGQDWTQLSPAKNLGPRCQSAMATDPVRNRIVLFSGIGKTGAVADTWEWDGATWILRNPKTTPPARMDHRMAYCPKTARITLFGGACVPADTWEWDGKDWTLKHSPTPNSPAPDEPFLHGFATQRKSGTILLYGGFLGTSARNVQDTWEWLGNGWRKLQPKTSPPPFGPNGLTDVRMVADATGRNVCLVGRAYAWDQNQTFISEATTQTWGWDGRDWKKLSEWALPVLEGNYIMGHDSARDEDVVIGSNDNSGRGVTWVLSQGRFRKVNPTTSPPTTASTEGHLVDHPGAGRLLLIGHTNGETWLWDGRNWTRDNRTWPHAEGHGATASAYDGHRGRVVLFRNYLTWEWEPANGWVMQNPSRSPPLRVSTAMSYDPVRRRTVLFGGYHLSSNTYVYRNDTWAWDGKNWTQIKTAHQPPVWAGHSMHYVPAIGGMLVFGGQHSMTTAAKDTWFFDGTDWKQLKGPKYQYPVDNQLYGAFSSTVYDVGRQRIRGMLNFRSGSVLDFAVHTLRASQPYPRLGNIVQLNADLPGHAGRPFLLALSLSSHPGIPVRPVPGLGGELLPLAPDPLFWLTLQAGFATVLDKTGKGSVPVGIPNHPAFLWLQLHAAGMALVPGPSVGAVTNRVPLEVVR